MTKSPTRIRPPVEVVTHNSQTDLQRLAMMMMQLDMALAMAREKGLSEVESHLETAMAEARHARDKMLQ